MTQSHYAVARSSEGSSVDIILKLRNPGPPLGQGHYGGTSLACELVFAILARALGMNVPDYGIIEVGTVFANGILDDTDRNILANNVGPNFASVRLKPAPAVWNPSHPTQTLELREALESVISFDGAIINGDRKRTNPNLLWDGRDTLFAIDHGLACPVYLSPAQLTGNPVLPDRQIQEHCGFDYLHGNGRRFETLLQRWASVGTAEFWQALEAVIPPAWQRQAGDLHTIFQFLVGREPRFADISAQLRRLVQ